MRQVDPHSTARKGIRAAMAAAAAAGTVTIGMSAALASANADPVPPPPPPTVAAPPLGEPNAPPPPVENPAQPEPGRVDDFADGFSYVVPPGWVQSDTSHLEYGTALLSKPTEQMVLPGFPVPVANDTRIVLGRLDQRLYASAEPDNTKAATRLASDMGEFYMPYPGTRQNQQTIPLNGNGLTGSASYYEVRFSDPEKPAGQIWAGVIGVPPPAEGPAPDDAQRWFAVWLGTANNPVDEGAAQALAESIRPLAPPPPAVAPPASPDLPGLPPAGPPAPPAA